jgi:hypothetical protein
MKLISPWGAVIAATLLSTLQLSAQNSANPIQVALLRWYQVNTAVQLDTCTGPNGTAFDGANIWAGYGQGSHLLAAGVYKL